MNIKEELSVVKQQLEIISGDSEVQEASINLFEDCVLTFLGDPSSACKVLHTLYKMPEFAREHFFWSKMELLLSGVCIEGKSLADLKNQFENNGRSDTHAERLLSCIDKVESHSKISYLINITNALLAGAMELPLYFRLCHVISNGLEEDCCFIEAHITEKKIKNSMEVQGLTLLGLMFMSLNEGPKGGMFYSFTPLGYYFHHFAILGKRITLRIEDESMNLEIKSPTLTKTDKNDIFSEILPKGSRRRL